MSEEIVSVYTKVLSKDDNWCKMIRVIFREFTPIIPYKVEIRCFKNGIPSHYGVILEVDVFAKLMNNLKLHYYCIVNNENKKRFFYLRSGSAGCYISTIDNNSDYSISLTHNELMEIHKVKSEIISKCFEKKVYYNFW